MDKEYHIDILKFILKLKQVDCKSSDTQIIIKVIENTKNPFDALIELYKYTSIIPPPYWIQADTIKNLCLNLLAGITETEYFIKACKVMPIWFHLTETDIKFIENLIMCHMESAETIDDPFDFRHWNYITNLELQSRDLGHET